MKQSVTIQTGEFHKLQDRFFYVHHQDCLLRFSGFTAYDSNIDILVCSSMGGSRTTWERQDA